MKATLTRLWNEAFIAVIVQGVPSVTEGGDCVYRGEAGRKCAAAHLMTPHALQGATEETNASSVMRTYGTSAFGIETVIGATDYKRLGEFLDALQRCHDKAGLTYPYTSGGFNKCFIAAFRELMLDLAKDYDLTIKGA